MEQKDTWFSSRTLIVAGIAFLLGITGTVGWYSWGEGVHEAQERAPYDGMRDGSRGMPRGERGNGNRVLLHEQNGQEQAPTTTQAQ
jgi:hypothetical protein